MTPIAISPRFAEAGVSLTLTCIEADVLVEPSGPSLRARLEYEIEALNAAVGSKPPADIDGVAAARRAYLSLGKDPTRYRVSSEALIRRVVQGKGITPINNVVDVNNLISLRSHCPVGSYRLGALRPPVEFRAGREGESYKAIARGPLNLADLPVFADSSGPFGSPTSDSERSMIRPGSGRVLLVVIDFQPGKSLIAEFAAAALRDFCGAENVETGIVGNEI